MCGCKWSLLSPTGDYVLAHDHMCERGVITIIGWWATFLAHLLSRQQHVGEMSELAHDIEHMLQLILTFTSHVGSNLNIYARLQ